MSLEEKMNEAIWICKTMFNQGKVTGSTSNLSFRHEDDIYITGTNVSFSTIKKEDFSRISLMGEVLSTKKPSKEFPLHLKMYHQHDDINAVIHTHSLYATLYSMVATEIDNNCIPKYTPYLSMKLGDIGLVDYALPGSQELFDAFGNKLDARKGYLLKHHGPVVADKDLMSAYYAIEELEESCHIAWELRGSGIGEIK